MKFATAIKPDDQATLYAAIFERDADSAVVQVKVDELMFCISPGFNKVHPIDLEQLSTETITGLALGPYCATCKRSLITVSFTEWSTAEDESSEKAKDCPMCGTKLNCTDTSLLELRKIALAALAKQLETSTQEDD